MPTVTLSRKVVESIVGKKLSIDELKEHISMLGTALEHIDDENIILEVFPNRPDWLSEQGLGRSLASFLGKQKGLKKYTVKKSGYKVYVEDLPRKWPYCVACIVKDLHLDSEKIREIIQLQEKLGMTLTRNRKKGGLGLYPLEKIMFPVTFKGMRRESVRFAPLGYAKEMSFKQILEQHPKGRQYGHIMKDWETCAVFVDASGAIMSMPPLINSNELGKIDENTTSVFIEGTGPDLNTIKVSLAILATSLADMGGTIHSLEMVYKNHSFHYPDLSPSRMKVDVKKVSTLLGVSLSDKGIKLLLARMGYGYQNGHALVPAYRADVLHPVDLIEDIAIAYGYDRFTPEIPQVATIAEESPFARFVSKLRELLIGYQFQEICSYHLLSRDEATSMMGSPAPVIPLANALVDYACLRNSILPSLLKVLQQNQHNEYPQFLFECGTIFIPQRTATYGIREQPTLSIAMSDEKVDFTKIRQVIDGLTHALEIKGKVEETAHPSFIEGRTALLSVGKETLTVFGELHPKVLEQWNLGMPVAAAEINIDALFNVVKTTR